MVRNVKTRKGGVYQAAPGSASGGGKKKRRGGEEDSGAGDAGKRARTGREEDDAVKGKEATALELLASSMASQGPSHLGGEEEDEDEEDLVPEVNTLVEDEEEEEEDLVGHAGVDAAGSKKHMATVSAAPLAPGAAQPMQPVEPHGPMPTVPQPMHPQQQQYQVESESERKRKEIKDQKRKDEDEHLSHPWAQMLMAKDAGYSRRETLATFADYKQDRDERKLCLTLFLQLAPLAGRYDQKDTDAVMDRIARENERGGPELKKLVALHNILNQGSMSGDWITDEPDFLFRVLTILENPDPADSVYKYHQAVQVLTFAYRKNYERSLLPNGPTCFLKSSMLVQSRNSKTNQPLPDGFWVVQSTLSALKLQVRNMKNEGMAGDKARMFHQGVATALCDLLDLLGEVFGRDHMGTILRLLPSSTAATRELLLQFCKQDVVECVRSHVNNSEFDKLVRGNHHIRAGEGKGFSVSV